MWPFGAYPVGGIRACSVPFREQALVGAVQRGAVLVRAYTAAARVATALAHIEASSTSTCSTPWAGG